MAPQGCGSPVTQVLSILRAGTRDAGLQSRAPNPNYAKTIQGEPMVVQWRKQIVEWIVEVAGEFRLGEDTLALTVNFFDRLLSAVVVPSSQLQTASLACLFIAAKLLERRPLSMRQIKKYFAEIASCDDVRMAELNILFYLRWDMNAFTALDFIRTALELVPDAELRSEIQKRAEAVHRATLLDYEMLRFHPCAVGFGCVDLACAARGFDAAPLSTGLRGSGIDVQVDDDLMDWLRGLVNAPSSPLGGAGCADALPSPSTVSTATLYEGIARPGSVAYSEASCAAGGAHGRCSSVRELEGDALEEADPEDGEETEDGLGRSRSGMDGVCMSRCDSEISVGRLGADGDGPACTSLSISASAAPSLGAGNGFVHGQGAGALCADVAAAEAAASAATGPSGFFYAAADQLAFRSRLSTVAAEHPPQAGVVAACGVACAAQGVGDPSCCSSLSHCSAFSAHVNGGVMAGCSGARSAYTAAASAPAPIFTSSAAAAAAGVSAAVVPGAASCVAGPGSFVASSAVAGPLGGVGPSAAAPTHLGLELGLGLALDGLFASQGSVVSASSLHDSARSTGPAGAALSEHARLAAAAPAPQHSSAEAHALLATLHEAHADGQFDEDEDPSRAAASSVLMGELLPSAEDVDAWEALVSPSARSSSRCDTTTMMSRCASTAPASGNGSSLSRHSSAGLLACAGASSAAMSDHAAAAAAAFGFAAGARFAQSCTVAEAVAAAQSLARGMPALS